jgi:integrase
MAHKRSRKGVFEYTFRNKLLGDRVCTRTFKNEREGDRFARDMEDLLRRGVVPDELLKPGRVARRNLPDVESLRAVMASYRHNCPIKREDHQLLTLLEERLPSDLTVDQLDFDWAESLVRSLKVDYQLKPGTILKYVGALARCLDWALNKKRVHDNPLRRLRRGYTAYSQEDVRAGALPKSNMERDRRLVGDEEERIRALLDGVVPVGRQRAVAVSDNHEMRLTFDLALETAMRMREIYTLSIDQVDLPRRTLFLSKTKNGDSRQIPLSTRAVQCLEGFIAMTTPSGPLFPCWWSGQTDKATLVSTPIEI